MYALLFVMPYIIKSGRTPLYLAAKYGDINVVKYLVKKAKVNPETEMNYVRYCGLYAPA